MRKIKIDDFIEIPVWKTFGMVIKDRPASYGSDDAQEVFVQESPEDERGTWYHLEPGTYTFMEAPL